MDKEKFTPWPLAHIVFLEQDFWVVERAKETGLYNIMRDDTTVALNVTEVQLIELGLARTKRSDETPKEAPVDSAPPKSGERAAPPPKEPRAAPRSEAAAIDEGDIPEELTEEDLLPWPEDDVVFLEGDWDIIRARTRGYYRYCVANTLDPRAVNAAQLVIWGMAAVRVYHALTPWAGSEIKFADGVEILRDLADQTKSEDARKYLIAKGGSLLRVNKYYLVKHGYASGSAAFEEEVNRTKLPAPKGDSSVTPWPDDDIVLAAPKGWTITRGVMTGRYRVVKSSGAIANWDAVTLVKEGCATSTYPAKLDKLAKSKKTTMSEVGEELHGFWLAEDADSIVTLRDIAARWSELEHESVHLERIRAYNREIVAEYKKLEEAQLALCKLVVTTQESIEKARRKSKEAAKEAERCTPFEKVSILTPAAEVAPLNEIVAAFRKKVEDAEEAIATVEGALAKLEDAPSVDLSRAKDLFPLALLPVQASALLQGEYDEIAACKEYFAKASNSVPDTAKCRTKIEKLQTELAEHVQAVQTIWNAVQKVRERQAALDKVNGSLYGKWKSPSIFRRPYREDGIAYTTGVKIKKFYRGVYIIPYDGKEEYVSPDELIYMGLAKRK